MDLQITFRDETASETLHAHVERRARKLELAKGSPQRCRVVVESPHRHQKHGRHYRVRIDLTVPGAELVIGSARKEDHLHEDAYNAVDDAFDTAERLLNEYVDRVVDRGRQTPVPKSA